jgi:hypothetical protein
MKKEYQVYQTMKDILIANEEDFYDVDMFCHDITKELFTETDPQDIDEDDYLIFQEALILLVRDDLLLDYFGLSGLCILHAELMDTGESYYVNKVCLHEEED